MVQSPLSSYFLLLAESFGPIGSSSFIGDGYFDFLGCAS